MSRHICMRRLLVVVLVLTLCFSTMPTAFAETSADSGASEENPYLTFTGSDSFTIHTRNDTANWNGTMEYSTDTETWQTWDGTEIASSENGMLYLRGTGNTVVTGYDKNELRNWTLGDDSPASISVTGNIEMLLDYQTAMRGSHPAMGNYAFYSMFQNWTQLTEAPTLPATTLGEGCYKYMFLGCTRLKEAPALPATSLAKECYYGMFRLCAGLTEAPALPATTLAEFCYGEMFSDCYSLTAAPMLPATSLTAHCYESMFMQCSSLTEAPVLPATNLADYCYNSMFDDCSSLTEAPVLPATNLADHCYTRMFSNCTSLTAAPVLPATTLAEFCYSRMFLGCTNLTEAPALPAETLAEGCYHRMFLSCTGLKEAPVLASTTLAVDCYSRMFQGCTSLTEAPALPAISLAGYCYSGMFAECTGLTDAPVLPAATLAEHCYEFMFSGCSNIKLSAEKNDDYQRAWFIPSEAAVELLWNRDMFSQTGGTFTGNPEIGVVYYQFGPSEDLPEIEITLDKAELTLLTSSGTNTADSTYQLTADISTDSAIIWTSSDESIATVDENGIVTAKTYGTAVITASSPDGASASCTVSSNFYDAAIGVSKNGDTLTPNIAASIQWMADEEITKGYDGVSFGSFNNTSRRDFVIFLWRFAGRPEVSGGKTFSDTKTYKAGTDTYKAIQWATSEGIINGYLDGTFRPNNAVTRAQVATMLWKYAGRPDASVNSSFPDVEASRDGLTTNMVKAINWCSSEKIVRGYSSGANKGKFVPSGNCLRFQMSIIIYRYNNSL